jgi:hypothetical protein
VRSNAIFFEGGIDGSSYTSLKIGISTNFNYLPTNYRAAARIKQLAAEGITGGYGKNVY